MSTSPSPSNANLARTLIYAFCIEISAVYAVPNPFRQSDTLPVFGNVVN